MARLGPQIASGESRSAETASAFTVLIALLANVAVAIAKGAAAAVTGSAAMLAETVHSIADVMNEIFLLLGVHRSERPADRDHPEGYGADRYFWGLLAAVGIFVAGGAVAIQEGIGSFLHPRDLQDVRVGLVVLAVSAGVEGWSWITARRQIRSEAASRDLAVGDFIEVTSDPAPVTVYFEDSAALVGLALAAGGLVAHAGTGDAIWDSLASVAVGLLLIWAAYRLIVLNRNLLIGAAATPATTDRIVATVQLHEWVKTVTSATVVYVGPRRVSVALDIAPDLQLHTGDLIDGITRLRALLLETDGVASVAVTLVGEPSDV